MAKASGDNSAAFFTLRRHAYPRQHPQRNTHAYANPHAPCAGVSLRATDRSKLISSPAKAEHTPFTRRSDTSSIFCLRCFSDPRVLVHLLQLSFPTGPGRHQLPPGNSVPEIMVPHAPKDPGISGVCGTLRPALQHQRRVSELRFMIEIVRPSPRKEDKKEKKIKIRDKVWEETGRTDARHQQPVV